MADAQFVPTPEMLEKCVAAFSIMGGKMSTFPDDVKAKFMEEDTPEEKEEMMTTFAQHTKAENGIMTREEFVVWQNLMGDCQKARYGHGLYFDAAESGVCYDGLACLDPSYEGVKIEDLGKIGAVQEAMANMGGGEAQE